MVDAELQYLYDSKIIELLASDPVLLKKAGLFDSIGFPSIASAIKSFVQSNIRPDVPGGYLGSIFNLLGPGILARTHPVLGIAAGFATHFGLNLTTIFMKFKALLEGHFNSGEKQLTMADADKIAKEAVGLQVGASLEGAEEQLVSMGYQGVRWGRGNKSNYSPAIDIPLIPNLKQPLLMRIFGNIGKLRGKILAAGILVWFFKTFLLGTGLVGAVSVGKHLVSPQTPEGSTTKSEEATTKPEVTTQAPGSASPKNNKGLSQYFVREQHVFPPSGKGQKQFPNDSSNLWVVPLINSSINKTLLEWALDVYPDAVKVEDLFEDSSAFKKTVQELKKNYNPKMPESLVMPRQFHSRKQVVDNFIEDVASLAGIKHE